MANMHINSKCGWEYKWTKSEDKILIENYPSNGWKKVHELLPHRDKRGIQCRAKKLKVKYLEYDENYFDEINTYQKAYWLGFLYADGYVTSQNRWGLELQIADKSHMQALLNDIKCNMVIKTRNKVCSLSKENISYESCYFLIRNKHMYDSLVKWGVVRNKTQNLKLPDFLSDDMMWCFLLGFWDGDGTFFRSGAYGKEMSCVCYCKSFLKEIKSFLKKEKISCHIHSKENLYKMTIGASKDLKKMINNFYKQDIICLNRKKEIANKILEYCLAH